MFKLFIQATGSTGNSYFIQTPEFNFALDAGIALTRTKQYLTAQNLTPPRFILVSHQHDDHLKYAADYSQEFAAPLMLTDKIPGELHQNFNSLNLVFNHYAENIYTFNSQSGKTKVWIKPFIVPHDVPNLGFQIQIQYQDITKHIVYITDCGNNRTLPRNYYDLSNEDKIPIVLDLLLMECNYSDDKMAETNLQRNVRVKSDLGHLSNVDSADYLFSLGDLSKTKVVLIHASGDNLRVPDDYIVFNKIKAQILVPAQPNMKLEF